MTIDADDITYQVKATEAAGRRLMKDRKSGLVFWATPETVLAAEMKNEEPVPSACISPDVGEGRELLPEFLRKEVKRHRVVKRKVDGS